ncbi:nuclear transport factor 2 family protein [Streptomyces sp. NPDC003077]|uniref:nuclear transport factor 2 family protein n=1 Tax=Streptomyces sp. NPDC003077 TaxID=3154443 RepID=UPI0033A8F629
MDLEEMQRHLRALTDRAEITDLLDRFVRSLDEGRFDEAWARAFYTEDAVAEMPVGTARGRDAVREAVRGGIGLFDRTVHFGTNPVITLDGDRATARGAQLSTHILPGGADRLFVSAGHTDTELVRTSEGWRIARSSLRVVWTAGERPVHPAGGPADVRLASEGAS